MLLADYSGSASVALRGFIAEACGTLLPTFFSHVQDLYESEVLFLVEIQHLDASYPPMSNA